MIVYNRQASCCRMQAYLCTFGYGKYLTKLTSWCSGGPGGASSDSEGPELETHTECRPHPLSFHAVGEFLRPKP